MFPHKLKCFKIFPPWSFWETISTGQKILLDNYSLLCDDESILNRENTTQTSVSSNFWSSQTHTNLRLVPYDCMTCFLGWGKHWRIHRAKHRSGKNRKPQLWKTLNPPSTQTTKRLDKLSICWHWLLTLKRNRALKYIWNETEIPFSLFFFPTSFFL